MQLLFQEVLKCKTGKKLIVSLDVPPQSDFALLELVQQNVSQYWLIVLHRVTCSLVIKCLVPL